jgi:LPS O-antigen subunit length determinant protein (WzzB/FepE family)
MRRLLIRIYPAAWRKRYGDELEELMSDAPGGWRAAFDVFKGAMTMRLKKGSPVWLVLGFMCAGAVAALALTYFMPQKWEAAGVLVVHGDGGIAALVNSIKQSESEATSRQSLAKLMIDPHLDIYKAERQTKPLEDIEDTMRASVHIGIRPVITQDGGQVFTVSFRYSDPSKARDTANALIARLTQNFDPNYKIEVLDPPTLPRKPIFPGRAAFMLTGLFGGLFLALIAVLTRRSNEPPAIHGASAVAIVLGLVSCGSIAGLIGSYLVTPLWAARLVGQVTPSRVSDDRTSNGQLAMQVADFLQQRMSNVLSRNSLKTLMTDPRLDLYRNERLTTPLEDIEDTMRRNIRIQINPKANPRNASRTFTITFTYPDARKAVDTVNELFTTLMVQSAPTGKATRLFQVLDTPALPGEPTFPKRSGFIATGGLAGMAIALATLLVRRRMQPPGTGLQSA